MHGNEQLFTRIEHGSLMNYPVRQKRNRCGYKFRHLSNGFTECLKACLLQKDTQTYDVDYLQLLSCIQTPTK